MRVGRGDRARGQGLGARKDEKDLKDEERSLEARRSYIKGVSFGSFTSLYAF